MKKLLHSMIVATFALSATPALSDQVFEAMQCKLVDEKKSEDDVIAAAKKWLAAARTVPGGKDLRLSIHFPVAGGRPDTDFVFVLRAPSFETWGRFWDNYDGSAAQKIDDAADSITECSSGQLFGGVDIQPE